MKRRLASLVALFLLIIGSTTAQAAEKKEKANSDGYTIEGISNKDQVEAAKDKPYFYLYKKPGQSGEISIKILNYDDKPHKYKVSIADANTNKNGVLDFTKTIPNNKALKTPLTSLTNWQEKEVSVGANGVKTVTVDYKMPNNSFVGIIDGAINVFQNDQGDESGSGHISMGSRYGYTLGIILTNTDTFNPYKSLSVELTTVTPKVSYGSKVVEAQLLNNNPYIFGSAVVEGKVTNLDRNQVVAQAKQEKVRIAPYQSFPFELNWGNRDMEPGSYLLKGTVKVGDKVWPFERKFVIKKEAAKKMNKEAVFKVYIPKWLTYSLYLCVLISLLVTIYLFVRKHNRGKKQNEEEKEA